MPKCDFCDQPADFAFKKNATELDPVVFPKANYCNECYEQRIGSYPDPDGYDPMKVKKMALDILKKRMETN
mgnify:CR=1 FL=1